jgi:hypothetical protein
MRDQFEVRITEATGSSRMLTPHVSNLSFRSVDPGGFGSVTFSLARAVDARNFTDYAEISVFDSQTGEQVGGGRLQNPGRSMSVNGKTWDITALGEGIAHAQERKNPYFLADSRLDPWYTGESTSLNRKWATGTAPNDESKAGLVFTIDQATVGVGAFTNANMYDVRRYKQEIGGFVYVHEEGRASSNNKLEGQLRVVGGSAPTDIFNQNWSTSVRTCAAEKGTDWSGIAFDLMNFVYSRATSTLTVDSEQDWICIYSAVILALRKGRDGSDVTGGGAYSKGYVLAHEAVVDALARWCPRFDLPGALIATTATHQHDSLVWPDGINTYDMLEYLMSLEPQFTWGVYEKQPNGLYRFEWRERDTRARYEIGEQNSVDFNLTGGQFDPLTRVWYTGTELLGHYRAVDVAADNPYAAQNIQPTDTRQIDRSNVDSRAWTVDATALATAAVTDSQFAATSATSTIVGLVFDNFTGRWIKPYQMIPGYICRLAGVFVRQDTLNSGYEPSAAKFRLVTNDYSVDAGSSTVELNSYTLDEARAIANLYGTAGDIR